MTVEVYVHDECGNFDFCVVSSVITDDVTVVGTRTVVEGGVVTEVGEVVQDVRTELMSNIPGYPAYDMTDICLLYTSPSPRDQRGSRMPSSA